MQETQLDRIERMLIAIVASFDAGKPRESIADDAATDDELDSEYGDPTLKKTPPRWKGREIGGCRYSELSIEELQSVVALLTFKIENPRDGADPKYAKYDANDRRRARGWIRRKKAGWTRFAPGPNAPDTDEPPF